MNRRCIVRAPASTANLGPGYDVLAAALDLQLELEVEKTGEFSVRSDVAGVPLDRSNLCVQAFEQLHPADGLSFRIRSEIPVAAGLGSSAAAIVAGMAAADHLFELGASVERQAAAFEGHPDNTAASTLGGLVICAPAGPVRLEIPDGIEAVLATPPDSVSTAAARAAMPAEVPLEQAVANIASAALLTLGLARGDLVLLARGLADRLHQDRRAHLYPRSMELVGRAQKLGALGATISGAGPTVLFWSAFEATSALVAALEAEAADCELRRLPFSPQGVDVKEIA